MENVEKTIDTKPEKPEKKKGRFNAPDAYIVLFIILIVAFFVTYTVPAGSFTVNEEMYTEGGEERTRKVIDPDSFEFLKDENGNPDYLRGMIFSDYYETESTGVLNAIHNGFTAGDLDGNAGMIAFILILGGAFAIVIKTGAVDAAIWAVIRKMKGKDILIIPIIMVVFSLAGAVMGLAEELIPFAMILIPLLIRIGYDGITALLTVYCSAMVGFSTTWMNPFTLVIAQGIADVPILSGAGLRLGMYVVAQACLIAYTLYRAQKYKKNPTASLTYELDQKNFRIQNDEMQSTDGSNQLKMTPAHGAVLLTLGGGFIWVFWGVLAKGWYIPQMSAQFMAIGIVAGILGVIFKLNGMRINDIAHAFKQGCSDLAPVVMILALGKGVTLVLGGTDNAEPSVLNTILYYSGGALEGLPSFVSAWGMYMFQALLNFLVPSGPAMAAITMPIMAPLSDILGVTRQTACLAYQLGDGFTNMIVPTSGVLMANLGIAKIDYGTWVKFMWKMQVVLVVFASIVLAVAVLTNYS